MHEAGDVRIARIAGLHARGPKATAGAHQLEQHRCWAVRRDLVEFSPLWSRGKNELCNEKNELGLILGF